MIQDPQELKHRLLLRLKGIESGRALIGPATVQIHLTDLCNLACKYCYYYGPGTAYRPTGKNHLPFEVFEGVMEDCIDLKVDTINLSGEGDPTLHPRFYDMLRRLEGSFEVSINSNGTFPIERCRDILRADRIVINLGESDREAYWALQGRDLFVRVIKNIRELSRLRAQLNPDFFVEVIIVVNRLNEQSQFRTESLVRKFGVNRVRRSVAKVYEHTRNLMLPGQEENSAIEGQWPPCYHGWFYSSIRLNGDVNVCCFMQRLTLGNIFKTSFKDIWQSDGYSRARALALKGDTFRNYHECINCRVAARNKEIHTQMEMYNRVQSMKGSYAYTRGQGCT